jgi:nicotinate dehydrogenase subunit A
LRRLYRVSRRGADTILYPFPLCGGGQDNRHGRGAGSRDEPGAILRLFLDLQAGQCGYCINGIIVSLQGLSTRKPKPSRDQVIAHLDKHHLCRCGAHVRILRIVDALFG